MKQDIDTVIRQRIRALRVARGWSLDVLAAACFLSPSTLSRIETGDRRIALDQLVPIARALETTLDELVSSQEDEDVVIRPQPAHRANVTTWLLSRDRAAAGVAVVKTRVSAGAALAAFCANRTWNVNWLKSLSADQLAKSLSHPERGELTLDRLLQITAGHDLNHLRQFEQVVAARAGY